MTKKHKINFLNIALMYVGTIMGAGFASGREIWQFFGVFDEKGVIGLFIVGILFVIMGAIVSLIARFSRTGDMGHIVVPGNNKKIVNFVGYFIAIILFTVIVNMSAGAGALFNQQFGINPIIGGGILVMLVVLTVIDGFGRMRRVFGYVMPILVIAVVVISILVITADLEPGKEQSPVVPSPLVESFLIAPLLYMSYNMLGVIPIVATASCKAKNAKNAVFGSMLGGLCLFAIAFLICKAMLTDPGFSQAMDMPMLGFAEKIGGTLSILYTGILFFAMYSSATSNYYGFTTKLKTDDNKKIKIVIYGIIGLLIGLFGFKNIVAYMLPIEGVLGLIIIAMLIVNFFKVVVVNVVTTQEKRKYDFPDEVINVTTGRGSAALLFIGSEKTALADCSMAYCGDQLVEKIKNELNGRPLDYVFASHTHYDHIGALPSLRKAWPELIVFGAQHGQEVLKRAGALKGIQNLGDEAAHMYSHGKVDHVSVEGMAIDRVLHDGDSIDLGGKQVVALETPGHTRCSMSYVVEPMGLMLACESVGVLERKGVGHSAVLHSFEDAMSSIDKCEKYNPKRIIVSHYGIVPEKYNKKLWKLLREETIFEKDTIEAAWKSGMNEDEIFELMEEKYWYEGRALEQPFDAFKINMMNTIRLYKVEERSKEDDRN